MISDAIWATFLILSIVLIVPPLITRMRFPQIAGLIIAGLIIGPGGTGIIGFSSVLDFFSRIGLLLIMFFAGLSIDIEEMKRTKSMGILFGILTFAVPWILCWLISTKLLNMSTPAAAIISCILGSHTLISYPIISRHGICSRKSVAISVSGALIAITLALMIYAFVQSSAIDGKSTGILKFLIEIILYVATILLIYPQIARLFFKKAKNSNSHFIFVLTMLALSCGLAGLIGLEGILGAFLAGFALNPYIPRTSPLMNRLDFIGNTLFIPLFLIDTGMMIDPISFVSDTVAPMSFIILLITATAGKWLPALIIQKTGRMERGDRLVLFGLSESHAAGALAMTMGASAMNIIDNAQLGTIVMIVLFSCIISNIITERGAKLLLNSDNRENHISRNESILVCLSGTSGTQALMDTSLAIRRGNSDELVGLHITIGGDHTYRYMSNGKDALLMAQDLAQAAEVPFKMQNRIGTNITESIVHAAEEFESTHIVMGLPVLENLSARYYENIMRPLIDATGVQQTFLRLTTPLNTLSRLTVLVPGPVVQDSSFENCMDTVSRLSTIIGCPSAFYGKDNAIDSVRGTGRTFSSGKVSYHQMGESADMNGVISNVKENELLILIGQRDNETHAGRVFIHLYERLHFMETRCSLMIIFPETAEKRRMMSLSSARTDRDLLKMMRI